MVAHLPRVIDIVSHHFQGEIGKIPKAIESHRKPVRWVSSVANPGMLSACSEARTEKLEFYKLCFRTRWDRRSHYNGRWPGEEILKIDESSTIYANWSVDTLLVATHRLADVGWGDVPWLKIFAANHCIRRLAIDQDSSIMYAVACSSFVEELILYPTSCSHQLDDANVDSDHRIAINLVARDKNRAQEDLKEARYFKSRHIGEDELQGHRFSEWIEHVRTYNFEDSREHHWKNPLTLVMSLEVVNR